MLRTITQLRTLSPDIPGRQERGVYILKPSHKFFLAPETARENASVDLTVVSICDQVFNITITGFYKMSLIFFRVK